MYTIYVFWTGRNYMSENRKINLKMLEIISEAKVILVTPKNLHEYILPSAPLHPAYEYLSEVHKSDYLRTYFMNFHGGGYSDIKQPSGSWLKCFEELENSEKWIVGYREIEGGVGYAPLEKHWHELIGNCAYICKPQTALTNEWYNEMILLLDKKLEKLKMFPASSPRDCCEISNGKYPIGWVEMLGKIFHEIIKKHKEHLLYSLPSPIFHDYM